MAAGMYVVVATGQAAERLFADVMPWVLALIGAALLGAVAIYAIRRLFRRSEGAPAGFTLQDLRAMHDARDLSDEEFARAKTAMIGRMKAELEAHGEQADPSSSSDTSDST